MASLACPRVQASKGSAWPKKCESAGNCRVSRFCPGAVFFESLGLLWKSRFLCFFALPEFSNSIFDVGRGCQNSLYNSVCAFLGIRYRKQSVFLGGPRRALFGPFFGFGWGVVRKNDALGNAVNIGVLEHLDAPHDAFL